MREKVVTVLGSGSWGTAFSTLLARNGYRVKLWCLEQEVAKEINQKHENSRYLPNIALDSKIEALTSLEEAIKGSEIIFEVIPVKFLRSVLAQAKPFVLQSQIWVILSKGIEQNSLLLPSSVLDDVFGFHEKKATLGGPNFAHDFALKTPTATTVASKDCDIALKLQEMLANNYFRPYVSLDLEGVQVGGAIKNAITLLIGIAKGSGCKDNTLAYLLTRGLGEMARIAQYYGGKVETIYGLSGLGDLLLTSMGLQSRNLKVGLMLGEGKSLDEVLSQTGIIPEGVNTLTSLNQLTSKVKLRLPICKGAYDIIFNKKSVDDFLSELMSQPLSEECLK